MNTQIERLTQAERMLAEIASAEDAVKVVAFAEAARVWAQQAKLGTASVNHATVIKMRAERRLADAVDDGQKNGEIATQRDGRRPSEGEGLKPTLEDIGITNPARLTEARKIRDNYTDDDLMELEEHANQADEVLSRKELIRSPTNAQRMQSSETNEWYTPAAHIEAARRVLGAIDLDPASSPKANETVQAARYYTQDDDGLDRPWKGRLWLNPPYGGRAGAFVERLVAEHGDGDVTAAVALVSSHSTDTLWFQPLWDYVLCFSHGRIPFISSDGRADAPTHGSVFAYLGPDPHLFAAEFAQFGAVVTRWA
jgi:phage N-6-adenine-methyltransferase